MIQIYQRNETKRSNSISPRKRGKWSSQIDIYSHFKKIFQTSKKELKAEYLGILTSLINNHYKEIEFDRMFGVFRETINLLEHDSSILQQRLCITLKSFTKFQNQFHQLGQKSFSGFFFFFVN